MNRWVWVLAIVVGALLPAAAQDTPLPATSSLPLRLVPGSMDVRWNQGAADCKAQPQPPLQVHPYDKTTFILRENLCSTFEAPFMYLLIGSRKAMLIDTGDVADSNLMPLAKTVMDLLLANGRVKLPLLVVHTHRHLDHRSGDPQFVHLPGVQVAGYDLDSVRRFYHFTDWPNGRAQIDLGDRIVDVIPTPGHNETEVSFYDRNTGLFFSGDFLMPGRLTIEDAHADLASAQRVAAFVRDRPVSFVLGGHIEMNVHGNLFWPEAHYHPDEHVLQMTKGDLLALPAAIQGFNGLYSKTGTFVLVNPIRVLIVEGFVVLVVLAGTTWMIIRYIRRRKRVRKLAAQAQA